jgi:TM2 domain-containing membrane protein YozV
MMAARRGRNGLALAACSNTRGATINADAAGRLTWKLYFSNWGFDTPLIWAYCLHIATINNRGKIMKSTTYTYKSKGAAVVLGLLLGGLGVHRFYLGNIGLGFAYLVLFALLVITPLGILVALAALVDTVYIACQDKEFFKRVSGYTEVQA